MNTHIQHAFFGRGAFLFTAAAALLADLDRELEKQYQPYVQVEDGDDDV